MSKLHPLFEQVLKQALSDLGMPQDLRCDDCEKTTQWKHAVQVDPWFKPTGETLCEDCAERRWYRQEERKMEDT